MTAATNVELLASQIGRLLLFKPAFLTCALALGATVIAVPADSAEAPQLKVLRHLTFDVTYGTHGSKETKNSGFEGNPSGLSSFAAPADEKNGTITADVVAATADGGLAIDVYEETPNRTPTVRFGVNSKVLMYDAAAAFTTEERMLVRYLARDLVQPTELEVGTTWTNKDGGDKYSELTTYKVTSIDADAKTIGVSISGSSTTSGLTKSNAITTGTMTYDTGTSVPQRLDIMTRTLTQSGPTLTTTSEQLTAKLVEDTFRKK